MTHSTQDLFSQRYVFVAALWADQWLTTPQVWETFINSHEYTWVGARHSLNPCNTFFCCVPLGDATALVHEGKRQAQHHSSKHSLRQAWMFIFLSVWKLNCLSWPHYSDSIIALLALLLYGVCRYLGWSRQLGGKAALHVSQSLHPSLCVVCGVSGSLEVFC